MRQYTASFKLQGRECGSMITRVFGACVCCEVPLVFWFLVRKLVREPVPVDMTSAACLVQYHPVFFHLYSTPLVCLQLLCSKSLVSSFCNIHVRSSYAGAVHQTNLGCKIVSRCVHFSPWFVEVRWAFRVKNTSAVWAVRAWETSLVEACKLILTNRMLYFHRASRLDDTTTVL